MECISILPLRFFCGVCLYLAIHCLLWSVYLWWNWYSAVERICILALRFCCWAHMYFSTEILLWNVSLCWQWDVYHGFLRLLFCGISSKSITEYTITSGVASVLHKHGDWHNVVSDAACTLKKIIYIPGTVSTALNVSERSGCPSIVLVCVMHR